MAREWAAEFAVSDDLARRLIASQFPDLAPVELDFIGAGFDNSAYLVNHKWVFRFPRRPMGIDLIKIEIGVLPSIQPLLPVPIPAPSLVGEPTEAFPYPFAGYERIPGETGDRAVLSRAELEAAAAELGQFLRALHNVPVESVPSAPGDLIRRSDLSYRIPWLRGRLDRSEHLHDPRIVSRVQGALDELAGLDLPRGAPCLVHGDLYSRHLLFAEGRLSGVIDWGDTHLGDPALDLSIARSFLPAEMRSSFWDAYGPVDDAVDHRAHFKALLYGVVLVEYGTDVEDEAITQAGRLALAHALGRD